MPSSPVQRGAFAAAECGAVAAAEHVAFAAGAASRCRSRPQGFPCRNRTTRISCPARRDRMTAAARFLPRANTPAPTYPPRVANRRRLLARSRCRSARRARRMVTGAIGPVGVKPPATLACPIVSALDQWINCLGPARRHALVRRAGRRDQTNLRLFLPRHERQSERADFRARLRQCARHRRVLARRRPQGQRAIWLAGNAGGAGISARRAGGRLRPVLDRARARRQRLSLQSHPRRPDAARERPSHLRACAPYPAMSSPSARGRATPRNITATPASPALSRRSRSGARSVTPARTATGCRPPFPARTSGRSPPCARAPPRSASNRP